MNLRGRQAVVILLINTDVAIAGSPDPNPFSVVCHYIRPRRPMRESRLKEVFLLV